MNIRIRRVGLVVTLCFLALFVQLNYLQVVSADRLSRDPRNIRAVLRDYSEPRGSIVAADGAVVARSTKVDDEFERQRVYPEGALFGHLSGFFSFTIGASGVESAYNGALNGQDAEKKFKNLGDWLIGREVTGDAVLTVSKQAQEIARNALGERKGSVVVLDPTTGAIVAAWSYPAYDPSPLAAHNSRAVNDAFTALSKDPANPMLARAYRERYPPGSTFKIVTAATALETGIATPSTGFPSLRSLDLPLTDKPLRNFGSSVCGGSLAVSFRKSCNTTFGQLGLDLGEQLVDGARAFGIGEDVPFDLPEARSQGPAAGTFEKQKPNFAYAGIGQGDVAVTPLQMAMVAGTIANGGAVMRPHVVKEILDRDGELVRRIEPREWKRAVTAKTALEVGKMMLDVVQAGTGTRAAVPGVKVAGKTGTAQAPGGPPHAWFTGFAPYDNPRFAIAVIVERGGDVGDEATGGRVAAPVAGEVLAKLLAIPPEQGPAGDETPAD